MLAAGADVNYRTMLGETPLMIASDKGVGNIVVVLLEAGTDVNAKCTGRYRNGSTALDIAGEKGNGEIMKLLEEAGGKSGMD